MAADAQNGQYDSPPFGLSSGGLASTGAPGSDPAAAVPPSPSSREGVGAGFGAGTVGDTQQAPAGGSTNAAYGRPGFADPAGYTSDAGHDAGQTMTRHPNSTAKPA